VTTKQHHGDHTEHAQRLRDRAEECRCLAEIIGEATARESYLRLAAAYDALAVEEELMHRPQAQPNKSPAVPDSSRKAKRA